MLFKGLTNLSSAAGQGEALTRPLQRLVRGPIDHLAFAHQALDVVPDSPNSVAPPQLADCAAEDEHDSQDTHGAEIQTVARQYCSDWKAENHEYGCRNPQRPPIRRRDGIPDDVGMALRRQHLNADPANARPTAKWSFQKRGRTRDCPFTVLDNATAPSSDRGGQMREKSSGPCRLSGTLQGEHAVSIPHDRARPSNVAALQRLRATHRTSKVT